MKITDYLLMKGTAEISTESTSSGQIPARRIILSIAGLIAGIFISFLITGIEKSTAPAENLDASMIVQTSLPAGNQTPVKAGEIQQKQDETKPEVTFTWPGLKKALTLLIISLVICGVSYQGLYSSLKLYVNEPAILVLFVAFQYGFFWQSVVKGVSTIL